MTLLEHRVTYSVVAVATFAAAAAVVGGLVSSQASGTAPGANGALVFQRFAGNSGDDASSQLYTLAPDGAVRQLTRVKGGAFHPAWAPDGSHVVFEVGLVTPRNGSSRLYTINADGSAPRALTTGCSSKCADLMASYSRDGKWIAFQRVYRPFIQRHYGRRERTVIDFASHIDVMIVGAAGGRPKLVKRYGVDPQPWAGAPQWSPDAKTLVLSLGSGKHPGSAQRLGSALAMVRISDGAQRSITPWKLGAESPGWSPDGRQIAFDSQGGHTPHVYVVHPDGSDLRSVIDPTTSGFPENPVWSPDGAQLAFDFGRGDGERGIYAASSDGSNPRPLVDAPQMEVSPAWAPAR